MFPPPIDQSLSGPSYMYLQVEILNYESQLKGNFCFVSDPLAIVH